MKVFVVGFGEVLAPGAGFIERGSDGGDAIASRQCSPALLSDRD
jgi:hypothetical protein